MGSGCGLYGLGWAARGTVVSERRVYPPLLGTVRRSGRTKKLHIHAGHHFVTQTYQHPTFCGHCKTLLWGLMRQGWTCISMSAVFRVACWRCMPINIYIAAAVVVVVIAVCSLYAARRLWDALPQE